MIYQVDLNCDMGESYGVYKLGRDEEILDYVSSANIACGFHAGDPATMRKTVRLALENLNDRQRLALLDPVRRPDRPLVRL